MCTTWGTLGSDSIFFQSTTIWQYHEFWPPQVISKLSYGPPYYICFSKKLYIDFSRRDTVDIEMKEIGGRRSPSK